MKTEARNGGGNREMGKERARPEFLNFEVVSAMICFALLGRSVISYQTITCIVVPRCTV